MDQLTVRDLVSRDFVGVSESDSVRGAIELMRDAGETSAVVLHGSSAVGTVSAAELLDSIADGTDLDSTPVSEIMHDSPVSVPPDSTVNEVASHLAHSNVNLVLVEAPDELIGVISPRELVTTVTWEPSEMGQGTNPLGSEGDRNQGTGIDEEYSNQSICEVCGSLTPDLVNVNGQLLCPDCRSM
ncbi:MAG: CBS domain-containing protein [Halodesulfurarchaeum sp.]